MKSVTPTNALRELASIDDRGEPRYPITEIRRIARDPTAHPLHRAAARQMLVAASNPQRYTLNPDGSRRLAGLDPEVGRAFDRVADRLEGKATQRIETTRVVERTPAELTASLSALLAAHPDVRGQLASLVAGRVDASVVDAALRITNDASLRVDDRCASMADGRSDTATTPAVAGQAGTAAVNATGGGTPNAAACVVVEPSSIFRPRGDSASSQRDDYAF